MKQPIDLKYIEELENELGICFPEIFKSKMLKENGGTLQTNNDEWTLFPFWDKSNRKSLSRTCNHIGLESVNAKDWENFPANSIAIGENGLDDLLILTPNKDLPDKLSENIFVWEHETGEVYELAHNINLLI